LASRRSSADQLLSDLTVTRRNRVDDSQMGADCACEITDPPQDQMGARIAINCADDSSDLPLGVSVHPHFAMWTRPNWDVCLNQNFFSDRPKGKPAKGSCAVS
jgi:hypothetical protein